MVPLSVMESHCRFQHGVRPTGKVSLGDVHLTTIRTIPDHTYELFGSLVKKPACVVITDSFLLP